MVMNLRCFVDDVFKMFFVDVIACDVTGFYSASWLINLSAGFFLAIFSNALVALPLISVWIGIIGF